MAENQNKKLFDCATVFAAAAVVQFVVPSPLDALLFPATATFLFYVTGQESAVLDAMRSKALVAVRVLQDKATDLYVQATQKKEDKQDTEE